MSRTPSLVEDPELAGDEGAVLPLGWSSCGRPAAWTGFFERMAMKRPATLLNGSWWDSDPSPKVDLV